MFNLHKKWPGNHTFLSTNSVRSLSRSPGPEKSVQPFFTSTATASGTCLTISSRNFPKWSSSSCSDSSLPLQARRKTQSTILSITKRTWSSVCTVSKAVAPDRVATPTTADRDQVVPGFSIEDIKRTGCDAHVSAHSQLPADGRDDEATTAATIGSPRSGTTWIGPGGGPGSASTIPAARRPTSVIAAPSRSRLTPGPVIAPVLSPAPSAVPPAPSAVPPAPSAVPPAPSLLTTPRRLITPPRRLITPPRRLLPPPSVGQNERVSRPTRPTSSFASARAAPAWPSPGATPGSWRRPRPCPPTRCSWTWRTRWRR